MSLSFESESDIDAKRRKRQEEWEKVRNADDPEKCPEEPYDGRSLYERLKEQKDKKEEEIAEQYKIRNMVKGLENDEVEFLDSVDRQKAEEDRKRWKEEQEAIAELKSHLDVTANDSGADVKPADSNKMCVEPGRGQHKVSPNNTTSSSSGSRTAQRALLSGVVSRKRSSSSTDDTDNKQRKSDGSKSGTGGVVGVGAAQVIGYLPGISSYDGSEIQQDSDQTSDSASSDSDIDGCCTGDKLQQKPGGGGGSVKALQAKYRPEVLHMG